MESHRARFFGLGLLILGSDLKQDLSAEVRTLPFLLALVTLLAYLLVLLRRTAIG